MDVSLPPDGNAYIFVGDEKGIFWGTHVDTGTWHDRGRVRYTIETLGPLHGPIVQPRQTSRSIKPF